MVKLADTSAWVEFLRGTGSETDARFNALLAERGRLAVTDPVVMEVLAGARDQEHRDQLTRLLARARHVPVEAPGDFEVAALIYSECRRNHHAISIVDCLIAAVALREHLPVLHVDSDFHAIAARFPLQTAE